MLTNKAWVRRIVLYALGLFILCIGVVLNTKTKLGVAAINVIPYVLSKTTPVSLGTAVFIMYCLLIVLQCVLKKKVDLMILLQLPVSLLFGRMVDGINVYVLTFEADSIVSGLVMLAVAINLVAIGTTLVVEQQLIPNAPDGYVQSLAKVCKFSFGKTKVCFDVICVCLAALVSMVLAKQILGIGIGTLCSMIFTGMMCAFYRKVLFGKRRQNENV